jgi:tetratricopeptide (TPR) repeat protein
MKTPLFLFAALVFFCLFLSGCFFSGNDPRIVPEEGMVFPAVSALAFSPDGDRFALASDDGLIRVWEVYTGRQLSVFHAELSDFGEGKIRSLSFDDAGFVSFSENGAAMTFPVFSPDGTKKLFPSQGALCLEDSATGKELARYYGFGRNEWVSVVPQGFFNASFNGASSLVAMAGKRHYQLDQLSGALYRPDIFHANVLEGKEPASISGSPQSTHLKGLFDKDQVPPVLSILEAGSSGGEEKPNEARIKISSQKGGVGHLALYRRFGGKLIPAGFLDVEKAADRKYTEKGRTCYEIKIGFGVGRTEGELGVSVFNKYDTVESGRIWFKFPEDASRRILSDEIKTDSRLPVLRVFLAAAGEEACEQADILADYFEGQAEGDLYSGVEMKKLFGEEFTQEVFLKALEELCRGADKKDMLVIYLRGKGQADSLGNLSLVQEGSQLDGISGYDIINAMLMFSPRSFLILDMMPDEKMETPLLRLRKSLGPKAMLAGFREPWGSVTGSVTEKFKPGFSRPGFRQLSVAELLVESEKEGFLAFPPLEDFLIAGFGENENETMMPRTASAISYSVSFGRIMSRAFGVNIAELNPANYRKIEREAMEGMGMAPYYVAFLSGGKFYTDGNYDKAIAEYGKTISLKADFADAYAARGNAQRRKGELDRAIDDYSRALAIKSGYAEVYNYRGFAYAEKGDLNRAISDYTEAIRFRENYADAYFNRAYAYGKRGDWDRAISDYSQVIKLEPSNAIAYGERGNAWYDKGEKSRAAEDYAAADKLKKPQ